VSEFIKVKTAKIPAIKYILSTISNQASVCNEPQSIIGQESKTNNQTSYANVLKNQTGNLTNKQTIIHTLSNLFTKLSAGSTNIKDVLVATITTLIPLLLQNE